MVSEQLVMKNVVLAQSATNLQGLSMFNLELLPDSAIEAEYIDGKRYYNTPDGNKYPSVTTILSQLNAKSIAEWRARVGEEEAKKISTKAATRGTKIHSIAESFVLNKGIPSNIMPSHANMFAPMKAFLEKNVDTVYGSEIGLYSDRLRLAGKCDLICNMLGLPTIVDFKTASKLKEESYIKNYFLQATAYALMTRERHKLPIEAFCILISTEHDGLQVFYKNIVEYLSLIHI